jgi:beta-glucosidase
VQDLLSRMTLDEKVAQLRSMWLTKAAIEDSDGVFSEQKDRGGISNLFSQHHVARDEEAAAVLALNAGVDADLPEGGAYAHLPDLVRAGGVPESQIVAAVGRILAMKFEAGLFENPFVDVRRALRLTDTRADVKLAREVATKSLILLKNDGLLPLDPAKKLKLTVSGRQL